MSNKIQVMDAPTTAFFQRELDVILAKLYEVQYPELQFRKLTPIESAGFLGQHSIIAQSVSMIGSAAFVTGATTKIPRSDVGVSEYSRPVLPFATMFGFSIFELEAAARVGKPLSDMKAQSARYAIEKKLNDVFWGVDDEANDLGIYGLLTHPNVPSAAVAGAVWTSKTPDQILFDINDIFSDQNQDTNGVEMGTRLLLPIAQYNYLWNTRLTDTGTNLMSYLIGQNRFLKSADQIIPCSELTGKMIAYDPNPMKMMFHVPVDAMFLPSQREGLSENIFGVASTGGVNLLRPKSVYIRTGI